MKLYDECDKLLECRILKQDEVVSSGEMLTFNAYLVDVGDPEGECTAIPDLNPLGPDKKISEESGLNHRQKLRSYSIFSGIAFKIHPLESIKHLALKFSGLKSIYMFLCRFLSFHSRR